MQLGKAALHIGPKVTIVICLQQGSLIGSGVTIHRQ